MGNIEKAFSILLFSLRQQRNTFWDKAVDWDWKQLNTTQLLGCYTAINKVTKSVSLLIKVNSKSGPTAQWFSGAWRQENVEFCRVYCLAAVAISDFPGQHVIGFSRRTDHGANEESCNTVHTEILPVLTQASGSHHRSSFYGRGWWCYR